LSVIETAGVRVLTGHTGAVNSVAFSPDGVRLSTASEDKTARVWNAATGELLHTLSGHGDAVFAAPFSPDGSKIATVSADLTPRLWDARTGAAVFELAGHTVAVFGVAFSPNGRILATTSYDETVRLWDTAAGTSLHVLEGHSDIVYGAAFSPDGRLLATASGDGTIRLWNAGTGACVRVLTGHTGIVSAVVFSPDGSLIATASFDGTARLWEVATGNCLRILSGHAGTVWSVAFSPAERVVATASEDATARIWDAASGALIRTLEGHTDSAFVVAYSPDGKLIATASSDTTVRMWESATGKCARTLEGHTGAVSSVAFSPADRQLATASTDETARIWALLSGGTTPRTPRLRCARHWPRYCSDHRWLSGWGRPLVPPGCAARGIGPGIALITDGCPGGARRLMRDDREREHRGGHAQQRARDHLSGRMVLDHDPGPGGQRDEQVPGDQPRPEEQRQDRHRPGGDRAVYGYLPHRGDRGEHGHAAEHAADVAGQFARCAEAHQQGKADGDRGDDEREHDESGALRPDIAVGPLAASHAPADEHHGQHPGEQRRDRAPGQADPPVGVPADGEGGGDDPVLRLKQVGDPLRR
jgi:WD40 repeat protein